MLGLRDATIGEVCLAARSYLGEEPSLDIAYFDSAVAAGAAGNLEEAIEQWRLCLEAGGMEAHYGLGYTLLSLDRPHDAYRYLRYYTEITPANAWAWCFAARPPRRWASLAEARDCYERAVELERDDLSNRCRRTAPGACERGTGEAVSRRPALIVSLTYSRSGLFGWHRGVMERGGYTATLDGFHDAGKETTVPLALDDLADKLSDWIESLDEVAGSMPHREQSERGESALSDAVRQLLREGQLRAELDRVAGEATLDPDDDPRR